MIYSEHMMVVSIPRFDLTPTHRRERLLAMVLGMDIDEKQTFVDVLDGDPLTDDMVTDRLKNLIEKYIDFEDSNEVTDLEFEGMAWWFTGGWSSGDDPTEAWAVICGLSCLPPRVWSVFKMWATEDLISNSNQPVEPLEM